MIIIHIIIDIYQIINLINDIYQNTYTIIMMQEVNPSP